MEAVDKITSAVMQLQMFLQRLEVSGHILYQWITQYSVRAPQFGSTKDQQVELRQLKAGSCGSLEARDILKKAAVDQLVPTTALQNADATLKPPR